MAQKQGNSNFVAVLTMIFLFGMISFVTNLSAPIGTIWEGHPEIKAKALGMMGNLMNFLAYAFMGIPAGKMLSKLGYKKTALTAIAVGFIGVFVQFLSGKIGGEMFNLPTAFYVYLLGAFISGFSVCMLNTVVNPMLKLLGGKRSNQYIQIGGSFNSLMGTLTPVIVMSLVGAVTDSTKFSDVNLVLYIAMAIFAAAFIVLLFVPIEDPIQEDTSNAPSPMKYRHFIWGIIAIFLYVGVEVGIPGTLLYYLKDTLGTANAATVAGNVAAIYWLLMLVGRLVSSFISGKVSSKAQLTTVSVVAIVLVLVAMFVNEAKMISMPVFDASHFSFSMASVPLPAFILILCGLCTSVMWGTIFDLAVEGLGTATSRASGIFMAMVVGGGILPFVQRKLAAVESIGYMQSYWVIVIALAIILYFAVIGSKVKKAKA